MFILCQFVTYKFRIGSIERSKLCADVLFCTGCPIITALCVLRDIKYEDMIKLQNWIFRKLNASPHIVVRRKCKYDKTFFA